MVDFSGVSLPFGVGELLSSATELLGVFGPFVLLGLAIYFAPHIWNLISITIQTHRHNKNYEGVSKYQISHKKNFKNYITGEERWDKSDARLKSGHGKLGENQV